MTVADDVAIREARRELERAREKWPAWPTDPVHAVAILQEEVGELTQAVLGWVYGGRDWSKIEEEAAQVTAMAIRFAANLDRYVQVAAEAAHDWDDVDD